MRAPAVCACAALVGAGACNLVFVAEATPGAGYERVVSLTPAHVASGAMPVSISIDSDAAIAEHARDDGLDFHVLDEQGATLPFELVAFDPETGALDAWFELPKLTAPVTVRLRYGTGVTTSPTMWSRYVAVWHLGDANTSGRDSGPGKLALSSVIPGKTAALVAGVAGRAAHLDGGDQLCTISNVERAEDTFSYVAWVNPTLTNGPDDMPLAVGDPKRGESGFNLALGIDTWNAQIVDDVGLVADLPLGRATVGFKQLAIVVDRQARMARSYIDGIEQGVAQLDIAFGKILGHPLCLSPAADRFTGYIDEVRLFDGVLSPDDLRLEHHNLTARATFMDIADEVELR